MGTFTTYDFLWKSDLQAAYDAFMATSPTTEVCMPFTRCRAPWGSQAFLWCAALW